MPVRAEGPEALTLTARARAAAHLVVLLLGGLGPRLFGLAEGIGAMIREHQNFVRRQ